MSILIRQNLSNATITAALVKIGVPAVPALMKALEDNNKHARKSAAEALKKIEGKK